MFVRKALASKSLLCVSCLQFHISMADSSALKKAGINKSPKELTQDEWKQILTPEEFYVTRQQGTERPHTGKYTDFMKNGIYTCTCCGAELFDSLKRRDKDTAMVRSCFRSETKFSAHCGWPSFYAAKKADDASSDQTDGSNVERRTDNAHGMVRTEIICKKCGAHLGHVFDDGPKPTGERFCVNSISLDFKPKE